MKFTGTKIASEHQESEFLKAKQQLKQSKRHVSTDIPLDPQKFYENVGLLEHPKTRELVPELTSYQKRIWNDTFRYKYRLVIKSQKVGITTSALMEDFQKAILPIEHPLSCRGREILIIAQNQRMAEEHLRTLQRMIVNSESYSNFLITQPSGGILRTEVTKTMMLYIHNPSNPNKPTRIIALGPHASGIWSWKNVKHIHMSDVAAIDQVDDTPMFGAAFSRLANTGGSMLIESPPRGQRGKVWDIYKQSELTGNDIYEAAKFKVRKIPADMAVDAGLIDQRFLEEEQVRLGPLYPMFYECEFINPFTSWYTEDMINYDNAPDYVEW